MTNQAVNNKYMMQHMLSLHDKIDLLSERLGLGMLSGQGDYEDD